MAKSGSKMKMKNNFSDSEEDDFIIEKIIEDDSQEDIPEFFIEDIAYPIENLAYPLKNIVYPLVSNSVNVIAEPWRENITNGNIAIKKYSWEEIILARKDVPGLIEAKNESERQGLMQMITEFKPGIKKKSSIFVGSEPEYTETGEIEKITIAIESMKPSINGEIEKKPSLRLRSNQIIQRCLNLSKFIFCPHFEKSKDKNITNFTILFKTFIMPTNEKQSIKEVYNFCFYGACDTNLQLHTCILCKFVCCLNQHRLLHQHYHAEREHYLAIDMENGFIYCLACNHYICDEDALQISQKLLTAVLHNNHRLNIGRRPNGKQLVLLYTYDLEKLNHETEGLRGLVNLGSTCFINCVVQALLHTPIVRDYLLGGNHVCKFVDGSKCLLCELHRIQLAFHDEKNKMPYIPSTLLYLVWTQAKHLAGYEQQDAHEFFISILDIMHRHSAESDKNTAGQKCHCLVDKIFSGCLQSDVECQVCGGVSSVEDPIWDFSLDLMNNHFENGQMCKQPASLHDCLTLYTRTEHLGSSAKIRCSKCDINQESTKRLSFKKLPIVASFHLKRFEQTTRYKRKISNYISFPLTLNLFEYTSSQIGANGSNLKHTMDMEEEYSNYFLYAVINHTGTLETGHYTAYIRQTEDEWYQCDDHFVWKATTEQVLQSEAYLLFYHKQVLLYSE